MKNAGTPRPANHETARYAHATGAGRSREILSEIAEDSLDSADRLRSEIHQGLQRLGQSPGIGHYHEELLDKRYRFWNFYSYVVAYSRIESVD